MLDIIIPLYHSGRLSYLLNSIASSKYIQDVHITLISDGDNDDYSNVLNNFINLPITFLFYEKNRGPGIARQYGLDHSNAPFITFIDSDDIFLPSGLDTIIETIKEYPDKYLYLFDFIENRQICSKIDHFGTMGQVYARKFLNLYNIRFPVEQPYYLEDYGFNIACMFILRYYTLDKKIYHIKKPLAENIGPQTSLTRKNYNEFVYKNWARGAAWNTKYAIDLALNNGVSRDFLLYDASKIMAEQFWFYCSTKIKHPEYLDAVLEGNKYYYKNCYKLFENEFGSKLACELWQNNYAQKIINYNIKINFSQFLQLCDE